MAVAADLVLIFFCNSIVSRHRRARQHRPLHLQKGGVFPYEELDAEFGDGDKLTEFQKNIKTVPFAA